ncbi:MAG: hypothetical protein V1735_02330 [Nanoarchaeota archaeon]
MNKKAFIQHPGTWIFIAFIAGIVLTYLVARGYINVPVNICGK